MKEPRSVLIVAYDFPPHGAVGTMRTLRLVRHLDSLGWKVSVLTGDPDTYLPSTPVDDALLARVPSSVQIIRAAALRRRTSSGKSAVSRPTAGPRASSEWKRRWPAAVRAKAYLDAIMAIPDREAAWGVPAVRAGLQELHRNPPDIVYSSAPPWTGQLVACVLAARLRRPWVADFRDPWARLPWRENRPWIVRRAAALFEDVTVRRAAAVVFTTRRIRDDVAAHHDARLSTKYHVIANGCDLEEFQTVDVRPQDSQFVLLHAGSLYGGRDPRSLMRAIATAARRGLLDPRRFRLRLLGTVALDGVDLPRTCNELGIGDIVEVVPRMSRRDSLAEMTSASALLLMQQGHPLSVPAKAYEYLASGRPILAIADEGETADLIRNSGGGMVISGRDEEQTVQALAELVRLPRHGRHVDAVWFDGARRSADVVNIFAAVLGDDTRREVPVSSRVAEVARRV